MRRAIPVLASTVGGLALLANFHTASPAANVATGAADPTSSSSVSPTTVGPRPTAGATPTTKATTTVPAGTRTVDGPVASTDYGPVQVRVVLDGTKIVDVKALQLPSDRSRSARISQEAGPLLREEVLQAQSANIDLVSGATYTSDGYIRSLEAALRQATH